MALLSAGIFVAGNTGLLSNSSSLMMHKRKRGAFRVFSSYVSGPFAKFAHRERNDLRRDDVQLFDASKEGNLFVPDKKLPKELIDTKLKATTHGWGLYNHTMNEEYFWISDHLNPLAVKSDHLSPSASESNSEVIELPYVFLPNFTGSTFDYSCQTEFVCNMALSSYPNIDDEDSIVAIKFFGRRLSITNEHFQRWRNIVVPWHSFQNSSVMYSKRDKKFYLPAPGGNYLCSWDLHLKHQDDDQNPTFHHYLYGIRPKFSQYEYELLDSYSKSEHWVESPSGERFLVKCYSFVSPSENQKEPVLTVFREEETSQGGRYLCYTEDIGDLCIFISRVNAFCLEVTSRLGPKRNSIYLVEPFFGVYDVATRNFRPFEPLVEAPFTPDEDYETYFPPHWLPPLSPSFCC